MQIRCLDKEIYIWSKASINCFANIVQGSYYCLCTSETMHCVGQGETYSIGNIDSILKDLVTSDTSVNFILEQKKA